MLYKDDLLQIELLLNKLKEKNREKEYVDGFLQNLVVDSEMLVQSLLIIQIDNDFKLAISGNNFFDLKYNEQETNEKMKFILFAFLSSKKFRLIVSSLTYDYDDTFLNNIINLSKTELGFQSIGRKKFLEKNFVYFKKLKKFIKENYKVFEDTNHTEAIAIYKLLNGELLTGGFELLENDDVEKLRFFVHNNFYPSGIIALFVPCSSTKPFSKSITTRKILEVVKQLNQKYRTIIDVFIVTEPIGIIPLQYELKYPAANYDMKLSSWIPLNKVDKTDTKNFFGQTSKIQQSKSKKEKKKNREEQKKIIEFLSDVIGKFIKKYELKYDLIITYVRSTHRQMIEKSIKKYKINIKILPTKVQVQTIIKNNGSVSWALNGLRSKESLVYLNDYIENILKSRNNKK